ncbi:muscle M-line assembly protein unc-89-like [Saccoglossus kowalevskii]
MVKWFKDDKELNINIATNYKAMIEDGKPVLVINYLDGKDESTYSCQVGNKKSVGSFVIEEHKDDEVRPFPSLDDQQQKQVILHTDIPSDDVSNITWFKDDKEIDVTNSDKYIITTSQGHVALVLKDMEENKLSTYSCKVGNEVTQVVTMPTDEESQPQRLRSIVADGVTMTEKPQDKDQSTLGSLFPPFITIKGKEKLISQTMREIKIESSCASDEIDSIIWFKNGSRIDLSDKEKYDVVDKSGQVVLVIKDVNLNDEGQYTCFVNDREVSTTSLAFEGNGETLLHVMQTSSQLTSTVTWKEVFCY